jgi:hypothetical protein
MENTEKDYTGRNICILSDSQTAINGLDSFQLSSKLVWEDHQSMVKLGEGYRIQLVWVPRHMRIDGNERACELAKESASHSLIEPEPVLGISADIGGGVIREWTSRKHEEHWQFIRGQRQVRGFLENRQ